MSVQWNKTEDLSFSKSETETYKGYSWPQNSKETQYLCICVNVDFLPAFH